MEHEKEYLGVGSHSLIEEGWVVWRYSVSATYSSWCILHRQILLASSCYIQDVVHHTSSFSVYRSCILF